MNYITLISDWGQQDPYVAILKGKIHGTIPSPVIFDLTHSIEILNMNQTAFLLKNSYAAFPQHTIHFILTGVSSYMNDDPVVAKYNGHYFIGHDTGIFSLLFFDVPEPVEMLKYSGDAKGFIEKMLALASACCSDTLADCTTDYPTRILKLPFQAMYLKENNKISGQIAFIDEHHNIITNIPTQMFREANKSGHFTAKVGSHQISRYHDEYVADVEPYFLPHSFGVLEIAAYKGRLALLASWQQDTSIDIFFK